MFRKVLIGIDGGTGGLDAVALARWLVADGGELVLAHVNGGWRSNGKGDWGRFDELERKRSQSVLISASEQSGIHSVVQIGATSTGLGLQKLAQLEAADLTVIGATTRSPAERILIGDDSISILSAAPCSVAIAPRGYADRSAAIREIGVGYDGSAESRAALAMARALAERVSAKVSVCEAVNLPYYLFGPGESYWDISQEVLAAVAQELQQVGGVEPHAVFGDTVTALTRYSECVDLLVLGTRSFGALGRLAHHQTTRKLAHTARCPLLVLAGGVQTPDQESSTREPQVVS
ncbi:MAG TPA: universal stress protein [Solirubrobacteraceae bacterium]|nr:universal stress protein [Solirubrobacteraceae bacterium]